MPFNSFRVGPFEPVSKAEACFSKTRALKSLRAILEVADELNKMQWPVTYQELLERTDYYNRIADIAREGLREF